MKTTTLLKQTGPCTFAPPSNKLGIIAVHWTGSPPPDTAFITAVIEGPLTAIEPKLREELAKPVIQSTDEATKL